MTKTPALPRTLVGLNARFASDGLPVELVKGPGYFYFVFEDGNPDHHTTESVMVYRFSDLPAARWYDDAREFFEKHSKVLDERRTYEQGGEFPISIGGEVR